MLVITHSRIFSRQYKFSNKYYEKIVYFFFVLMFCTSCRNGWMVLNNKTNETVQVVFTNKDSSVYVYSVAAKQWAFYTF